VAEPPVTNALPPIFLREAVIELPPIGESFVPTVKPNESCYENDPLARSQ
jgi:hypothetical protein